MHGLTSFDRELLRKVPLQSHYLYSGNWNPGIDRALIDSMMRLKMECEWKDEDFPPRLLHVVAQDILDKCGVSFTQVSVLIRIGFMSARRRTFSSVLATRGTYWSKSENFVYAVDTVWVTMIKV